MVHLIFERLEKVRLLHNLSADQMSTIMGIDERDYHKLSKIAHAGLEVEMLIRLHDNLQVSADYLLFGIEPILKDFNSSQSPKTREELDSIKMHIRNLRDQLRPSQD